MFLSDAFLVWLSKLEESNPDLFKAIFVFALIIFISLTIAIFVVAISNIRRD